MPFWIPRIQNIKKKTQFWMNQLNLLLILEVLLSGLLITRFLNVYVEYDSSGPSSIARVV